MLWAKYLTADSRLRVFQPRLHTGISQAHFLAGPRRSLKVPRNRFPGVQWRLPGFWPGCVILRASSSSARAWWSSLRCSVQDEWALTSKWGVEGGGASIVLWWRFSLLVRRNFWIINFAGCFPVFKTIKRGQDAGSELDMSTSLLPCGILEGPGVGVFPFPQVN